MFRKKKQTVVKYDRENMRPVLRCSICNGEQVAGLKDIHTGKFQEVMLIRNEADLEAFKAMYQVDEVWKEY
ncbi:MAG: aspartate dehydrogenase [Lachnospiraceae bacterium]|nr:aspartate dehydrogenase [Lachnospiraceae bacterium]